MAGFIRTVLPTPRECEIGWSAANRELTVGSVVLHVAFSGMLLAPGVFVWGDILGFSEIGRACVKRGVQVVCLNDDPVRHAIVRVTTVIVGRCDG